MLERYEVETFLTLAEELHFGRTAERLRVTTGRVSHVVKKLERRIGAPLFARTSRVVRLTPIGRQLADDLAPLVAGMDEAVRRAVDAGRGVTGTLRVAFLGEWTAPVLLRAVALFSERHPDCEVEVHEAQLSTTRSEPARRLDRRADRLVPVRRDGHRPGAALRGPGAGGGRRPPARPGARRCRWRCSPTTRWCSTRR